MVGDDELSVGIESGEGVYVIIDVEFGDGGIDGVDDFGVVGVGDER